MRFPKLHLICTNDELRPVMMQVFVSKEFTVASDAHILVRHSTPELFSEVFVASLPDEPILIPGVAFKLVCQKATERVSLSDDKKNFQIHRVDGSVISYRLFTDGTYPKFESVIPDSKDAQSVDEIGINSSLLDRLSDGMGCDTPILHLHFYGKTKAITATTSHSDYVSVLGLIMPVIIND